MWEYKRLDISYKSGNDLDEQIKKLGENNWEIIYYYEVPTEKFERTQRVKILAKRPKMKDEH